MAVLAYSMAPDRKAYQAFFIEDIHAPADLMGFWLDFYSFQPLLFILYFLKWDLFTIPATFVLLTCNFTSVISWARF
jgi:hypothetical protein